MGQVLALAGTEPHDRYHDPNAFSLIADKPGQTQSSESVPRCRWYSLPGGIARARP